MILAALREDKNMDMQIVCQTCMKVHGRDTNAPVQCPICKKIVGCHWHGGAYQHIRACKDGKRDN